MCVCVYLEGDVESPQRESYALCVFSLEHSYLKLEEHGSSGKVIYSHFSVVWFVGLL